MSELSKSHDTDTVAIIRRTDTHLVIPGETTLPFDTRRKDETLEKTAYRLAGTLAHVDHVLPRPQADDAPVRTYLMKVPLESITESDLLVEPATAETIIEQHPMPATIKQLFNSAARLI